MLGSDLVLDIALTNVHGFNPRISMYKNSSKHYIEEEFRRLTRRGRHYLVLHELLHFRTTGLALPVDVCHLGVMWMLDSYVFRCLYDSDMMLRWV